MKKAYELVEYEYDSIQEAKEHQEKMIKKGWSYKDSWCNSETESTTQYEKWNSK